MKRQMCETTDRGKTCPYHATLIVKRRGRVPILCCEHHAQQWYDTWAGTEIKSIEDTMIVCDRCGRSHEDDDIQPCTVDFIWSPRGERTREELDRSHYRTAGDLCRQCRAIVLETTKHSMDKIHGGHLKTETEKKEQLSEGLRLNDAGDYVPDPRTCKHDYGIDGVGSGMITRWVDKTLLVRCKKCGQERIMAEVRGGSTVGVTGEPEEEFALWGGDKKGAYQWTEIIVDHRFMLHKVRPYGMSGLHKVGESWKEEGVTYKVKQRAVLPDRRIIIYQVDANTILNQFTGWTERAGS